MRRLPPAIGDEDEGPAVFAERWVSEAEAVRLVRRSARTLRLWRSMGQVRCLLRQGRPFYRPSDLMRQRTYADQRQRDPALRSACGRQGGRPRHPARPRIRELLAAGYAVGDVARQTGVSAALVRAVRGEQEAGEG